MVSTDKPNSNPKCVFELSPTGECTFSVQKDSNPCIDICEILKLNAEFGEIGLPDNPDTDQFKFFIQGMVEKVNLTTDPDEKMNG